MVSGFTKFKKRFQGFENQYVIIGGTAVSYTHLYGGCRFVIELPNQKDEII